MSDAKRRLAQVFPPGEFIREELEARGWTQGDLAVILGRPIQIVNGIVNGKKIVTPETAKALGAAFGTSAEFWMKLEATYRLSLAPPVDPGIMLRSKKVSTDIKAKGTKLTTANKPSSPQHRPKAKRPPKATPAPKRVRGLAARDSTRRGDPECK